MNDETTITRWRALLIGVREYEDPAWAPVRYAVDDVEALAKVLRESGYESVQVLHDDRPAHEPTIQNICTALETLTRGVDERTLLLVYFAGHGDTADERAYLLPWGRTTGNYARFALDVHELEERLHGSGARAVVLIMDACHAGARIGARGGVAPDFVRHVIEQAQGMAVLSASSHGDLSWEDDDLQHGVFTYYLLEALRGQARQGDIPYVTVSRAYEHVLAQVAAWAEQHARPQQPTLERGVYGDPPLLRLPRRREVNPFVVGAAVRDPARFYGRQAELQAIVGRVGAISALSISIVGERRIGKSSLLWQVKQQAADLFHTGHRYVVVYLDLSSAAGSSNRLLMRTLRRELERAGLPAWNAADDGDLAALSDALEDLEAQAADARLVLLLDEFESINDHPAEFDGLLYALRAERQLGRLALVTASRTPLADLCAQGRIVASPFFNIFTQVTLGPLDEAAWRALVRGGLGEVGAADWRFIAECAGHHPFLTQLAASLLWEARRTGAVDYAALQAAFDVQAAPHRAYWQRHAAEAGGSRPRRG